MMRHPGWPSLPFSQPALLSLSSMNNQAVASHMQQSSPLHGMYCSISVYYSVKIIQWLVSVCVGNNLLHNITMFVFHPINM